MQRPNWDSVKRYWIEKGEPEPSQELLSRTLVEQMNQYCDYLEGKYVHISEETIPLGKQVKKLREKIYINGSNSIKEDS